MATLTKRKSRSSARSSINRAVVETLENRQLLSNSLYAVTIGSLAAGHSSRSSAETTSSRNVNQVYFVSAATPQAAVANVASAGANITVRCDYNNLTATLGGSNGGAFVVQDKLYKDNGTTVLYNGLAIGFEDYFGHPNGDWNDAYLPATATPVTLTSMSVKDHANTANGVTNTGTLYVAEKADHTAVVDISGVVAPTTAKQKALWRIDELYAFDSQGNFAAATNSVKLTVVDGNRIWNVKAGVDNNNNGNLDANEITKTAQVIAKPTVSIQKIQDGSETGPTPYKFTLTRVGDPSKPLTVSTSYSAHMINAIGAYGGDFGVPNASYTFAAGQSTIDVSRWVIDDNFVEGDDTITVTIGAGGSYIVDPAKTSTTLVIHDNDTAGSPPNNGGGNTGGNGIGDPIPPNLPPAVPKPADGTLVPTGDWVDIDLGAWWTDDPANTKDEDGAGAADTMPDFGATGVPGESHGRFIRLNSDFDELTTPPTGTAQPKRDYETSGILPGDGEVQPLSFGFGSNQTLGNATWSLAWDADKVKVWTPKFDENHQLTGYEEQQSGWSGSINSTDWGKQWSQNGFGAWIEGIKESTSLDDASFTVTLTPQGRAAVTDTVKFTVVDANILIDMNNDKSISDADETAKYFKDRPGMTMVIDGGDTDGDFIPDFADGYTPGNTDRVQSSSDHFVPMRINLPAWMNATTSLIHFNYDDSQLDQVLGNALSNFAVGGGSLRLWRKAGNVSRDGRDVKDGGDLLSSGTDYTAAQLGLMGGSNNGKLFIEVVDAKWQDASHMTLAANSQNAVNMTFLPNGAAVPVVSQVWGRGVFDRPGWQYVTYREAGISVATFNPSSGYSLSNEQNLDNLYTFYGVLHAQRPRQFEWMGLAKVAGASVIKGVRSMENVDTYLSYIGLDGQIASAIVNYLAGPVQENLKDLQSEIIQMAKDVFEDMGWQHVAFRAGGIDEIRRLDQADQIKNQGVNPVLGWEQIDAGGTANVDTGNFILIDREQNVVLEQGYAILRTMPLIETNDFLRIVYEVPTIDVVSAIELGAHSSPFSGALSWSGYVSPYFNDGTHGPVGYLADAAPRFRWITYLWRMWEDDWLPAARDAYVATPIGQLSQ